MKARQEQHSAEVARALAIKRQNAITASVTGIALVLLAEYFLSPGTRRAWAIVPLGFVCGVIYANAFEYVLHRWFLHCGQGFLVQRHALHHNSDEPRYVNFASSLWVVVLLFVANAIPVFVVLSLAGDLLRGLPWGIFGAGIFAGFTLYYMFYEEIHWRIHMGGWIPVWLGFARRHHLLHHGDFPGYYNVFLPLFDWLVGLVEKKPAVPIPS